MNFANDANQVTWPASLLFCFRGDMDGLAGCDRLRTNREFSKGHSDQVMIISFDDFLRDTDKFVQGCCRRAWLAVLSFSANAAHSRKGLVTFRKHVINPAKKRRCDLTS